MTKEEMLKEIASLPLEAQRQIEDFIAELRKRHEHLPTTRTARRSDLRTEPFVGMWRDRADMRDSTAWVRNVREKHWGN